MIAPQRIPKTLQEIATQGAEGFQAYSEGIFDDVNKALLGGISSGKFAGAKSVLKNYAARYFAADHEKAEQWANWLAAWGRSQNVKLPLAAEEFEKLARGVSANWRLEQWRSKLKLEALDRAIGLPKPNEWTAEKLKLAEDFGLNKSICSAIFIDLAPWAISSLGSSIHRRGMTPGKKPPRARRNEKR